MSANREHIEILYEISMSIGQSLDLEKMLKQALTVFLRKLNCSAGGVFLYGFRLKLKPKIRTFLVPRTLSGSSDFGIISDRINELTEERRLSESTDIMTPIQFTMEDAHYLIMELKDTGFLFLKNHKAPFSRNLVLSLKEPVSRLTGACIACYQNDAMLQSQYDLEIRVARRTNELEERNNELNEAYLKLQKAQKQLIHNEKMVSIGQLSAGVAHEINNPTGFITSNLFTMTEYFDVFEKLYKLNIELLEKKKEDDGISKRIRDLIKNEDLEFIIGDGKQLISESIEGAGRIKDIVSGLRDFARTDGESMKTADINEAIDNALRLTRNELKYKCEVVRKANPLPLIPCRPEQLTQVFVNILVNASQAINEQGTVTVESFVEDNIIIVRISDTGEGISPANMSKLFDPFFTTKDIGKGTGLGLSISHGIIEEHGGDIEVESTLGKGTSFTVSLPAKGEVNGN